MTDAESGEPLIGATVAPRGTATGTITDMDGRYSIQAEANATLLFSYIGYEPQERTAAAGELNVRLAQSQQMLDDVVIVGYGVQKKSVVTAALSRVDAEALMSNNPTSIQYALQGKASGVQITANSGQPGSGAVFRIRGTGTINDNTPLYLIDGFPAETAELYAINPADISSIEILKDAAAGAIYGARAANGVVLITTKSGEQGKAKVTYDFSYGIQNPWRKMPLVGAADYQMLINESYENAGQTGPYENPGYSEVDTDWQSLIIHRNAPVMNHQIGISGGTDKLTYYVSFSILNQEGIFAKNKSKYDRYALRSNTTYTIYENKQRDFLNKVVLGSNIAFTYTDEKGIDTNNEFGGQINGATLAPPNIAPYTDDPEVIARYDELYPNYVRDRNGNVYTIFENITGITNPLASMEIRNRHNTNHRVNGNFSLTLDLWKGLSFRSTMGLSFGNRKGRNWSPAYYLSTTNKGDLSSIEQSRNDGMRWQWENVLSYATTLGEKHSLSAIAGTSAMKNQWEWITGNDYDLILEQDDKAYINSATEDRNAERVEAGRSEHMLASMFARVSYNYDEKYLIEATLRRDGSSNFAPSKQYAYFPSVSLGWVFTREGFLGSVSDRWFTFGKLRASWGQNGNENIGSFNYTTNMTASGQSATFGTDKTIVPGMRPQRLANPELTWETSEQTNIGLDLRFFDSALSVTADWFVKKTRDMLMTLPIPNYVGNSAPQGNVGTMKNKGIELDVSYRRKIGKVQMNVGANVSHITNKVVHIGEGNIAGDSWNNQTVSRSENGYPYKFFYGYVVDGIFRSEAEVLAHVSPNGTVLQPDALPGDFRFRNLNGDDAINSDDRTFIGQSNPDWLYGFSLGTDWNGFDFNLFFQGQAGNKIYDGTRRQEFALLNFHEKWLDRYHAVNNPNGNYPRVTVNDTNDNMRISSFFVRNGDYLRLKNIQLGYTLPARTVRSLGLTRLRIYTSIENALTFTSYKGFDPEVGNNGGIDKGNYPQPRTYTFGLNLAF
ncbi:MAG: TonB-dependent receptor [Bacteroides sp.]|nr:TonB-dependent receptor [Bacteroides sp.]